MLNATQTLAEVDDFLDRAEATVARLLAVVSQAADLLQQADLAADRLHQARSRPWWDNPDEAVIAKGLARYGVDAGPVGACS